MVLIYASNNKITFNRSVMKKQKQEEPDHEELGSTPNGMAFTASTIAASPFMNKKLQPPTAISLNMGFATSVGGSMLNNFSFRNKDQDKNIKYRI
jgi:hypothetical protein